MTLGRSLLLSMAVGLSLTAQATFEERVAAIEPVLARYFRGPRLDELREASNRAIETFNVLSKTANAELAEARQRMEQAAQPGRTAYAGLQKLDAGLKTSIPDGNDKEGNAKYAAQIAARNALARQVNDLNAAGQRAIEEYNALATRTKATLEQERLKLVADQEAVNLRVGAYESFAKSGEDLVWFGRINRLLADLRTALRKEERPELRAALAKVRRIRQELGAWAMAGQARNPKGLVIIETLVGDEPCWLIVDSGATETILSEEVADAAGLKSAQGEAVNLVVVGGLRLQGQHFTIPRLVAGGQTLDNVSASAVRPADVGIDGLLGQSFLKAFVYTVDERTPGKLLLVPR